MKIGQSRNCNLYFGNCKEPSVVAWDEELYSGRIYHIHCCKTHAKQYLDSHPDCSLEMRGFILMAIGVNDALKEKIKGVDFGEGKTEKKRDG